MANHQCQGMSDLTSATLPATKDNHANKPRTDARTRRHRAMAIPPLRTEMARTVLHGSSRQQHHNVNASVLQPSGDPDGLRRHALSVENLLRLGFSRLLEDVVCLFSCKLLSTFLLSGRERFPFLLSFFFGRCYSMIPTFAREHRTYIFLGGKGLAGWSGWDGIGLALGNALDGEKHDRRWDWEAMGDVGAGSGWRQPSEGSRDLRPCLYITQKLNKIQDQQEILVIKVISRHSREKQ